jgi:hypothetical protein
MWVVDQGVKISVIPTQIGLSVLHFGQESDGTLAPDQSCWQCLDLSEKKLHLSFGKKIGKKILKILPVLTREHYTSLLHWV